MTCITQKTVFSLKFVSIRDGVRLGSCPFWIVSVLDRVRSGSCPFGNCVHSVIVSIRDCVIQDRVFQDRVHLGNCADTRSYMRSLAEGQNEVLGSTSTPASLSLLDSATAKFNDLAV